MTTDKFNNERENSTESKISIDKLENYKSEGFEFNYNRAYTASVEFKTIVDETTSGKEQRRDLWTKPQRRWVLECDKNKIDREQLVNFFIAQKGQKKAFDWTWNVEKGGDGNTYRVRFAVDKLELNILELGYSNFKIELVEVFE